jgi:hypothetical protein
MKKLLLILFLISISHASYSDGILKDAVYSGNPAPLDNLIIPHQLMDFTPSELRLLRNMIYAKYNYKFKDNDLQEHFSQFSWYNGIVNNVENYLTNIDYRNISTISTLERHYPAFFPYNDSRIHDLYDLSMIMGWSKDGKLFWGLTDQIWDRSGVYDFGIFDIKKNNWLPGIQFGQGSYTIDEFLGVRAREHNILPVTDRIPTMIEGYTVYSKKILEPGYTGYYFNFEIGLENNYDNSTIKLGNFRGYGSRQRGVGDLTENDIWFLCVRSPFEENIIVLVVIIPVAIGGENDAADPERYEIFGIDLTTIPAP